MKRAFTLKLLGLLSPVIACVIFPFTFINAQASLPQQPKGGFAQTDPFRTSVFLENKGIVDPYKGEPVLYYTGHDNIHAFFTEKGVIYKLHSVDEKRAAEIKREEEKEARHKRKVAKEQQEEGLPVLTSIIKMEWAGANPHPRIEVQQKGEGYYTYLKKNDTGYTTLQTEGYKKMIYHDLYPGIDAEYTFPGKGGIEYALIVHPGANPNVVKAVYSGAVKKINQNNEGDIVIYGQRGGELIEHAPVSYTGSAASVASQFTLSNNTIQFGFPAGYDKGQTLTIDPWMTSLTNMPPENIGMKVDFDFLGNLFVYGSGPTDESDITDFFQVAKYTNGGTFLWEFNGQVPVAGWTTAESGGGGAYNYSGGFRVDKVSGKSYVSQGFNFNGTQTVRLTSNGTYDNFISTVDATFREAWGIMYNCSTDAIINVGGGTNSDLNMGIINTTTAAVTTSNITGITGNAYQDIICAVYDSTGNMYAIMNDGLFILPYTNTIYKINAAYNGNVWAANSTYTTFAECNNQPYWSNLGGNWNNCLAANGSYLYYYDGYHIAAFDFATGAMVGTPTTIPGYTAMMQGGIAVDACNHLYLGGQGCVKVYSFNGATFTAGTTISLGGAFAADGVHDVALDNTNNELYIAGTSVIGTAIAIPSITCVPPPPFKIATATFCDSTSIHISPDAGLNPVQFTYILFDTAYNVLNQQPNSTDTILGFGGLNNGTYYLQVQWNANCGGVAVNDTIQVGTSDSISPNTAICPGTSVILSAHGVPGGGIYSWQPGGATDSVITVNPTSTTTYYCSYTPPSCNPRTDSVVVTVASTPTLTVNDSTICAGGTANLSALASLPGGTFLWTPGGDTTASINVAPASTTVYTVAYNSQCDTPTQTTTVTVQAVPVLTPHNDTICQGSGGQLSVSPSIAGGTYLWSPGGQTTQTIPLTGAVTGSYTYTVTYTSAQCAATDSAVLVVDSMPVLTITNDTVCEGAQATVSVTPNLAGGTYLWTPGNQTSASINVNPNITTTYTATYKVLGCSVTGTVVAVVDPMPVLTMTSDSICIGNSGQVIATPSVGGGTYVWAPVNGNSSTLVDAPLVTTVYTVTYTAALCSVSGSATITVLPLPGVTVAPDTSVCHGSAVQLTATPNRAGGTFSWAPGGYTAPSITVLPFVTTTYTVTYVINSCGAASDSATVTVLPIPTLTTTDTAFCAGGSGQISVTPSVTGGTYMWSPGGSTGQSLTVSPASTSTYTVTYNLNGCTATDSATATVYPNPAVTVTPVGATCSLANGGAGADVTGGTAPYFFIWSNSSAADSIANLAGNQTYSVSVQDVHGCSAVASASVTQTTAITAVTGGISNKCPGVNDALAWVTGTGGALPYIYDWSNGETTDSLTSVLPGSYNVTVSDMSGCSASASVTIQPVAPDTFTVVAISPTCHGPEYQDGYIVTIPLTTVRMPYEYALNGGAYQTADTFAGLGAGAYSITMQDDSGCLVTVNNIAVNEAPVGTLSVSPADTTISTSQTVQLSVSLVPYTDSTINTYSWSPGFGLSCFDCPNPVVSSYAAQNNYTVTVTYNDNCTASAAATVEIKGVLQVFIPDVFTPNHDGNNDVFYIYGNGIRSVDMKIFNRWGEKVFESSDAFNGWDGTYKGELQPDGVYVYEATIYSLDNQTVFRKGTVTLLR